MALSFEILFLDLLLRLSKLDANKQRKIIQMLKAWVSGVGIKGEKNKEIIKKIKFEQCVGVCWDECKIIRFPSVIREKNCIALYGSA
jgi:hypothetical protein